MKCTRTKKIGLFLIFGILVIGLGFFLSQKVEEHLSKGKMEQNVSKVERPFFNVPIKITSKDLPINEE